MDKKKRYIVVDQNHRPMVFCDRQLCYAPRKFKRVGRPTKHILESYTEGEAMNLIKKTKDYRKNVLKLDEPEDKYLLMQIKN